MTETVKAEKAFRFYTRLNLAELTGLKASNLEQLLELLREVPGSCIYHHTHRFLQQHQHLSPEPPNDFAYWAISFLGEHELGEKLASIDTVQFASIRSLREKIISVIGEFLAGHPRAKKKFVNKGEEFFFIKSLSFILPTDFLAYSLSDFAAILKKITIDSIYFHVFESRLRLERGINDFSYWIDTSVGDKALAVKIANLDPYTYTLEELRRTILKIVESHAA